MPHSHWLFCALHMILMAHYIQDGKLTTVNIDGSGAVAVMTSSRQKHHDGKILI